MSSKPMDSAEILKNIEKNRYLIPCKCKLCNQSFDDLVLGTLHISANHRKREKRNVIDNLSWNMKADLKRWEILQELKSKRYAIINRLSDDNAIDQAKIPDIVEIQRKKADISEIMKALLTALEKTEKKLETNEEEEIEEIEEDIDERDFEESDEAEEAEAEETTPSPEEKDEELADKKSANSKTTKKRNLRELLERELEKYVNAIKRLTMSSEVEKAASAKKKSKTSLDKFAEQLDYFLGVAKAVRIIKESNAELEIII